MDSVQPARDIHRPRDRGYVMINIAFLFIGIAMLRMPRRLWRAAG
jgi:hypothetical protein